MRPPTGKQKPNLSLTMLGRSPLATIGFQLTKKSRKYGRFHGERVRLSHVGLICVWSSESHRRRYQSPLTSSSRFPPPFPLFPIASLQSVRLRPSRRGVSAAEECVRDVRRRTSFDMRWKQNLFILAFGAVSVDQCSAEKCA